MGLSIVNKMTSVDCTTGSFYKLRKLIAYQLGDDVGDLYSELWDMRPRLGDKDMWTQYNKKIQEIADKYGEKYYPVFDFLYASDCDGRITPKEMRVIHPLVMAIQEDFVIGYPSHEFCSKFSDFQALVDECYKNRWVMKWY